MTTANQLIKDQKEREAAEAVTATEPKIDLAEWLQRPIDVSIIVPIITDTKELVEMTLKCIAAIANTTRQNKIELIIVDNGSKLPAYFRPDIHLRNPINIGYGPAINQGIKLSHGKYIVAMNNDVFAEEGWLDPLIRTLEEDPMIGVVRPIAVGESAYGAENAKRKFGEPSLIIDQKDFHGFCYLLKRETLDNLLEDGHYFDEQYAPAYCEDMDMWVRLTKAGYKMARNTDSKVQHLGGATSGAIAQKGEVDLNANRIKFFKKHGFDVFTEDWYTGWQELQNRFGSITKLLEAKPDEQPAA